MEDEKTSCNIYQRGMTRQYVICGHLLRVEIAWLANIVHKYNIGVKDY
jgi:hypothetical protein